MATNPTDNDKPMPEASADAPDAAAFTLHVGVAARWSGGAIARRSWGVMKSGTALAGGEALLASLPVLAGTASGFGSRSAASFGLAESILSHARLSACCPSTSAR